MTGFTHKINSYQIMYLHNLLQVNLTAIWQRTRFEQCSIKWDR